MDKEDLEALVAYFEVLTEIEADITSKEASTEAYNSTENERGKV